MSVYDPVYCVRCKADLIPTDDYCPKCGQPQRQGLTPPPPMQQPAPGQQHQVGQQLMPQQPYPQQYPPQPGYAPPQHPAPQYQQPMMQQPIPPQPMYPQQAPMMYQQPPVVVMQQPQQQGGGMIKGILTGMGVVGGVGLGCIGLFFIVFLCLGIMCARTAPAPATGTNPPATGAPASTQSR